MTIGEAARSERARVVLASASFFPTLGVRPAHGRFFTEAEDKIGAPLVAVIGDAYWRTSLGGDSAAIGKILRAGKGSYTIIGIAPPGFTGVGVDRIDIWLPMRAANAVESGTRWATSRRWWWISAIARIDPARETATAAAATLAYRAGRAEVPNEDARAEIVLASIIGGRGPDASQEARVAPALAGLAIMVLLLSCANVANLMLARGIQRRRQLAIQTAIGMSRRRLLSQAMIEIGLLAGVGGALALAITRLATPLLFRWLLPTTAVPGGVSLRLATFMVLTVAATTLFAGMLPALQSARIDAFEALRFAREARRGATARQTLLFVQACLCAFLLVGAGMFLRSLERARAVDLGVDPTTLTVQLELMDGSRFGTAVAEASYDPLNRIRALPSVASAAVTSMPHFFGNWGVTLWTKRDSIPSGARGPFYYGAGGKYFETIGLRILRGRGLTDDDDRVGAAPVAVVSESLARLVFPGVDAVGECLYVEERTRCTQVVGMVEDALPAIRAEAPNYNLYLPPHHPDAGAIGAGTIVVRPRAGALTTINEIRTATLASRTDIRLAEVKPLGSFLDWQFRSWRLGAALLTAFGALAILVAVAGIFSALAFDVAQRRFELAVRSALGASAAALVRTSTARALMVCGAGTVAGVALAAILSTRVGELLFRVSPVDARVHLPVLTLMLVAIGLAGAVPAWRAVRADPRGALQDQ
jgi:predicted permease